jgi:hypothetical protein
MLASIGTATSAADTPTPPPPAAFLRSRNIALERGCRDGPVQTPSRASSVSNSKRNCAASSSGSQFVICGKIVR